MNTKNNILLFAILFNTLFTSISYSQSKEKLEKRTYSAYYLNSEKSYFNKVLESFFEQTQEQGKKRIYTDKESKEIIQQTLKDSAEKIARDFYGKFQLTKKAKTFKNELKEKLKIKYSQKKLEFEIYPKLDLDLKKYLDQASIQAQAKISDNSFCLDYEFIDNSANLNWSNSSLFNCTNKRIGFSAEYNFREKSTECFLEFKWNF